MSWTDLQNRWLSLKLLPKPFAHVALGVILVLLILMSVYFFLFRIPANFPLGSIYTVKTGTGLTALAQELSHRQIIRSPFLFKVFIVILGGPKGAMAGDYILDKSNNVYSLAKRITDSDYHLDPVKVTLPEGLNIYEMAKIISTKLPKVSEVDFVSKAQSLEGYLFPDTYVFQTNTGIYTVIEAMQENFDKKILTVSELIKASGKTQSDIIKMASILEEEARTTETRRIIAGILWKRFALGMPLQVDASFKYINGKTTKTLTLDDLKIDSPYNSYLYKGLPPTPISNPGLDSIRAALTPIKTEYLYFLTDQDGKMHYARTFAEHLQNKELYLI